MSEEVQFRKLKSVNPIRYGLVAVDKLINRGDPTNNPTRFAELKEHFDKLVQSMKDEGVRNPLIGTSHPDGSVRIEVGYSRAWAAKEAGIEFVPCLVNDAANIYEDFEVIMNINHARQFFKDQPHLVKIMRHGITSTEPLVGEKTWWE